MSIYAPPAEQLPSFFDLIRWAEKPAAFDARVDEAMILRQELPLRDPAVSVGLATFSVGAGVDLARAADEFLHVIEGELLLNCGGVKLRVGRGQSAAAPAGSPLQWRAEQPTRALYMLHPDRANGEGVRLIDPKSPRAPSNAPLAELLTTPTPSCRNLTQFRSADQTFTCGVWDSTPYARRAMTYAHHELMHLLEGEVTFEDELGVSATFAAGDTLLVRRGARCSWDSRVPVTKVFAIHRPE